jgi:hypothetical protein
MARIVLKNLPLDDLVRRPRAPILAVKDQAERMVELCRDMDWHDHSGKSIAMHEYAHRRFADTPIALAGADVLDCEIVHRLHRAISYCVTAGERHLIHLKRCAGEIPDVI